MTLILDSLGSGSPDSADERETDAMATLAQGEAWGGQRLEQHFKKQWPTLTHDQLVFLVSSTAAVFRKIATNNESTAVWYVDAGIHASVEGEVRWVERRTRSGRSIDSIYDTPKVERETLLGWRSKALNMMREVVEATGVEAVPELDEEEHKSKVMAQRLLDTKLAQLLG